jgi:hypothetical protein
MKQVAGRGAIGMHIEALRKSRHDAATFGSQHRIPEYFEFIEQKGDACEYEHHEGSQIAAVRAGQ